VFLSPETYEAVLTDMSLSLKSMGFKDVVLMGDSGGNQNGMKTVAAKLNAKMMGNPARFHFIPDYYDYPTVRKYVQENGVPEKMEFQASSGSDGIHEEYSIDAIMMLHDPKTVRLDERIKAGRATINGVSLLPVEKTLEMGRRIVELRANQTVAAIRKSMAAK
jgi:creatinine amidohydrolase